MKSTFTLEQLAIFALNQLLSGIQLDEACDNLSIFERLDDQEESKFFGLIEEKAKATGMVLSGEYLRPMTELEDFIYRAQAPLTAYTRRGLLILESGQRQISFDLDEAPRVITTQRITATAMGLIALVYFQTKGAHK
ncbi:MAG: hypothetical protein RBR82_05460 [Pseudomonas sp.]|jgi:hypothetical protein|nr:hypothetical protein [Pseudomonas sp.]